MLLLDCFHSFGCWLFQCGRNSMVLEQTYQLQERATSLDNCNAVYMAELGYELLLQGRTRDALRCYQSAAKLDDTSITALTGETGQCCRLSGCLSQATTARTNQRCPEMLAHICGLMALFF